ncbi:MAG TPA: PQQ-dependent sugar dehydrogenase [Burkholderiales bacterium]|nr:PQQ-dependent sugar dehydrogenase [Burkholderiales bacterium]
MPNAARCLGLLALACASLPALAAPPIDRLRLPEGFRISVYANGVDNARSMALGDKGTVFVGTRSEGDVYALVDADRDGKADEVITIARGLNSPNGVAFRNGALYVAEINRILRYDDIESNLKRPPRPVVVSDRFPRDGHHGWKFIAFGPDGMLYVPVGAPCNVCEANPDVYAAIHRMRPDGSGLETFARGVRNTVGFDWHPVTGELWFNEHGRDMMGDDMPSCELNNAPRAGMHFGFPYCHQGDTADPEYGRKRPCGDFTPPALKQGGHVAPDGLRFYTGKMFPAEYRNRIFIAQHGSWNRSSKSGYRVIMVTLKADNRTVEKSEPFVEGWLEGERAWGRPVDLLQLADGSLLISDDAADAVYRVTYGKQAP